MKRFSAVISVTTDQGKGATFRSRPQVCTENEVERMKEVLTNVSLSNLNFKVHDEQLVGFPKHTLLNSIIRLITTPVPEE